MKKKVALLLAVVFAACTGRACDVCGCAGGGQYFGLLPQASRSFAGVQYQYYRFNTAHPSLFENRPQERSTDVYSTVQAWGRYSAGKRLQLFAFVPYRYNVQQSDTSSYRVQGLGDVTLIADVILLNADGRYTHQLLAGGGVKLPTGAYAGISEMDKLGLPNMQPGTGSTDFLLNANYTLRRENSGINLDASYTLTTPNKDKLKYGNKLATGIVAFHAWDVGRVSLLPQAGGRYEFALHDYDNYQRRWLNEQSGGYMVFSTVGLQAYLRRVGARAMYSMPVAQRYSTGYVQARAKVDLSLFILL